MSALNINVASVPEEYTVKSYGAWRQTPQNVGFDTGWKKIMTLMLVFWVVTPCGLVGRYQCFGETYCLYIMFFM
jgi:hypothetical protein